MRRRAGLPLAGWLPVALLTALVPEPALAQTEGLIRLLRLDSLRGWVELGYELEEQERESPGSRREFGEDEDTLIFGLNLDLAGSFLHPTWLPFSLGGTLRLRATQVDTTSGRFEGDRDSDASQYRLRLGIVPEARWSGQLVATRFVQDLDSTFVPRRTFLRQDLRLTVHRRSRTWPLRFEVGQGGSEGLEGDPRDESRERIVAHIDHFGTTSSSRAEAEVLDYVEDFSRQDYRTVRLTANHRWRPGGSPALVLNTSLYGFDRTGTSEFKNLLAGQGVEWRPWETLSLTGSLETREQEEQERLGTLTTRRGQAQLEHLLWGSLTSRLAAQFQRIERPEGGTQDLDQIGLTLDYLRHLERGNLSLLLAGRLRRDDDDLPDRRAVVREDRLYEPGVPIFLDSPNVLPGTVVVTDAEGEPFLEGFDYQIVAVGDLVELRVLPTGSILPGETLRITYAVASDPSLDVRTRTRRLGGGWRSRAGWWFRLTHTRQDPEVLVGTASGRFDRSTERIYSAGYERSRWRLNATVEDRESEILPYRLRHFGGSWDRPLGRAARLTLRGRYQRNTFPDRGGESRSRLAAADYRLRRGRLRLGATVQYWHENILGRQGRYFESLMHGRWRYRTIELLANWRLRLQRVEDSGRDDRQEARLVIRRYFR